MNNYALKIAYDGTQFYGWQKNGQQRSVEEVLEKALVEILGHPVSLQATSRTDAGVHADAQVVNFFSDKHLEKKSLLPHLHSKLPHDLAALDFCQMPEDFHPTLSSNGKIYRYFIDTSSVNHPLNRFSVWHYPRFLDIEKMKQAALYLVGQKDFKAFSNTRDAVGYKDTLRTITKIEIKQNEDKNFIFEIEGTSFLYKMVRNIVGTLVYVGSGKLQPIDIPLILKSGLRKNAGVTAPAHGLRLHRVLFPSPFFLS